MSLIHGRPTVTTTAAPLWNDAAGGADGDTRTVTVQNTSAQAVFVGASGVSASVYGYSIPATTGVLTLTLDRGDMLYAIVAATTAQVNVLVADVGN